MTNQTLMCRMDAFMTLPLKSQASIDRSLRKSYSRILYGRIPYYKFFCPLSHSQTAPFLCSGAISVILEQRANVVSILVAMTFLLYEGS